MRAALNELATVAPDWLRAAAPEAWHKRYAHRVEDGRLPRAAADREAYARTVGEDGFALLARLDGPGTPGGLRRLPRVEALRQVWARHFVRQPAGPPAGGGGVRLRGKGDPSAPAVVSPYDTEARYRGRHATVWTGYVVHTIRTQSTIRLCGPLAPRRGAVQRDDMPDLQAALVNDDALDHELQHRLLIGERGLIQPAAHPFAERGQVG